MEKVKKLHWMDYLDLLKAEYDNVYSKIWSNSNGGVYYYDKPDFDGATQEIGIYTAETAWGIKHKDGSYETAYSR